MNKFNENGYVFLRQKVAKDVNNKVQPFNKSLVSYSELDDYLFTLARQYPDKDIPVNTWRLNELYRVLKELGGVHLRYNATVDKKTVGLNMWIMYEQEKYLAMPRGELIREWKRAYSGKT
jgi:hypothetical protein